MWKSALVAAAGTLLAGVAVARPATESSNTTRAADYLATQATGFWYANMDHSGQYRGYAPDLGSDYNYPVFKAVSPGDGAGIQRAINVGTDENGEKRHQTWLSAQPRVVYIPPGTYEVSSTIVMNTDTILMGDATNPPIIKAASNWKGQDNTLLTGTDPGVGKADGTWKGELSFAVGLKNLILDTSNIAGDKSFVALDWSVAQGAQLQNVKITMAYSVNGKGHSGIRMGRGSTLTVADVRIEKGQNGIQYSGHQQALFKGIYFFQNTVAMLIESGSTVTLMAPVFDTCGTGVRVQSSSTWVAIIDARSVQSGVTFVTDQYPSWMIENLTKDTDSDVAQNHDGTVIGRARHVDTFTYGNTVGRNPPYAGVSSAQARPANLAPGGYYPVTPAPTYADRPLSDFINAKDPAQNGGVRVLGDGTVDEAAALNQVLAYAAARNKIVYLPFGRYRVERTVLVPRGSRIVGEAWATISAAGTFFADAANPQPVVAVGRPGDVGVAQIQDVRVTVAEALPGAVLVRFEMAGTRPGDVGLWNSLVLVGGTRGADGLRKSCNDVARPCRAAFLGLHFAGSASAYVENVWNWVADHATEGPESSGTLIAAKGGALVEARGATWLHGLGSEHWWLYQLNVRNAGPVLVSLLQSETNYDQGDNARALPPAPWTADVAGWGDPNFAWCRAGDTRCNMGLATWINGGDSLFLYAAASWAFFSGPNYQPCNGDCQNYIHWIEKNPTTLQAFGLCNKDTWAALRLADGTSIETRNGFTGSWTGVVGRYTP